MIMDKFKKYQNKKFAIYGMGITGCSAASTLKNLKAKVFCWDDSSKVRQKIKKLNFKTNKFWLNKEAIDSILISPGIDVDKCKIKNYLKKNYSKIITDLDLFFDLNKKNDIISITGTNGKSTTCKILEKIFKVAKFNVKTVGNIGKPILNFNNSKKNYIFILETSSYQLQYSKIFRSRHAAILNISPDHLERHKNLKKYIYTKSKIFFAQQKSDFLYLNLKNKYSRTIKRTHKHKKIKSKLVMVDSSKYNFLLKKINNSYFNNKGNIENLLFAYNIAKNFKIKDKVIIKSINNFKGLPHRQEIIFSNKKVICINDSKATSFDAALQSLTNYKKIYWILGGLPKAKDKFYFSKISKNIVKAYIIGNNVPFFVKKIKKNISYTVSKNLINALNQIFKDIKQDKNKKNTILLSPAAASYDQFKNFEERGNYYKNLIFKKFNQKLYV